MTTMNKHRLSELDRLLRLRMQKKLSQREALRRYQEGDPLLLLCQKILGLLLLQLLRQYQTQA